MSSLFHLISISALVALRASAHVIMVEPHPFNLDTEPLYQTWPLSADLPFPCQGRTQHAEQVTKVTAGSAQTVKLWGSAVHGGGSCQFSVAYGDSPSEDPEDWHTIYSIIGGCPAEAAGNVPTTGTDPHGRENGPQCGNDADKECTRQFDIPIPKDMKNGPAVFAWTWFNKIGNREMYMVCAPIEVVGGTDDSSFVDALPPIFRANIPGECTTGTSGSVINFPEPGDFGKVYEPATPGSSGSCPEGVEPDFKEPSGGDAAPSKSRGPKKPLSSSPAQPSSPSSAQPSSHSSENPSSPSSENPNPSSSEKPSEAPVATFVTSATPSAPASSATTVETPAQETNTAAPGDETSPECPCSSSRPDWAVGMEPCPVSGALICLEETVFGICNQGWALPQAVPAGTKCIDGYISMAMA
ncbi:hypothetical protein FZEAL_6580 [Fusarium zealandicum]|uniref:Lytic polysaccharide monooxygenase n=1 Tax=Fusarium zealandicum TaxID=1053134 RepID=A0A8H4UII2_9HYPO|nr:hypothetical protein FZEAL_6580 [Fusarium zealandicum]